MLTDTYNQVTGLILQNQSLSRELTKRARMLTTLSNSKGKFTPGYLEWTHARAIATQKSAALAYERIAFLRDL